MQKIRQKNDILRDERNETSELNAIEFQIQCVFLTFLNENQQNKAMK